MCSVDQSGRELDRERGDLAILKAAQGCSMRTRTRVPCVPRPGVRSRPAILPEQIEVSCLLLGMSRDPSLIGRPPEADPVHLDFHEAPDRPRDRVCAGRRRRWEARRASVGMIGRVGIVGRLAGPPGRPRTADQARRTAPREAARGWPASMVGQALPRIARRPLGLGRLLLDPEIDGDRGLFAVTTMPGPAR